MAYLFEFLSDFFQYVYTVDFLYFMFSSVENALLFLAWIFIIVPTMLYATQSYKPKNFLGYITVALYWCVCGFLVVLNPFSLLLYFFYQWLYKKVSALWPKWKSRMRPWFKKAKSVLPDMLSFLLYPLLMFGMMVFVAVYAIFVDPFLSLLKWIKQIIQNSRPMQSDPPVNYIAPEPFTSSEDDAQQLASRFIKPVSSENSSQPPKESPAHEVCRLIWQEVDMYIKYVDQSIDRKQHMYLWAAYFYVVVKTVRDKKFINDVYSHFDKFAIRYVRDPGRRAFVVQEMKADYREIRPLLNASKIVPNDASGRDQLWTLVSAQMYKHSKVPANADRQFAGGAIVLSKYSLRYYRNSLPVALVERYSIDTSGSEDFLPDT